MWSEDIATLGLAQDNHFYAWLCKPLVLSAALRNVCKHLSVQVISQQLTTATIEEQHTLNISENNSLIRKVYLCGDGIPLVYAKTVIPHDGYIQYKNEIDNLGSNLIGADFLFKQPNITRGPFSYAVIKNPNLYARRSIFKIKDVSVLVTEIFLSNIPKYMD